MKFRGLLAAVVVLAALGGAAWWSEKKQKADAAKPSADSPPKILTIPDDQFKQIDLVKKAGDTTALIKADGKWQIVQPKPLAADQDSVNSLVSSLASLASDRLIEDNLPTCHPTDLPLPLNRSRSRARTGKRRPCSSAMIRPPARARSRNWKTTRGYSRSRVTRKPASIRRRKTCATNAF